MRKVGIIVFICFTFLILFLIVQEEKHILKEEKTADKKVDDFILHMKVDREKNGIAVHQSLQYIGDEEIEILHQTPLISVSITNKNHDYTGSLVPKVLKKGSIYYQDTVKIPVEETGENPLYVEARFFIDEKMVRIEHMEPLMFN